MQYNVNNGQYAILLFQGVAMIATLLVALQTYKQSRKIEDVKGLTEVRKMLATDRNIKIHARIAAKEEFGKCVKPDIDEISSIPQSVEEYKDLNELYDYLGTLELAKIYLKEEIIDKNSFFNQFGYRIINIVNYNGLCKHINGDSDSWEDLQYLIAEAKKYYKLQ
jgi:hypothetical protein